MNLPTEAYSKATMGLPATSPTSVYRNIGVTVRGVLANGVYQHKLNVLLQGQCNRPRSQEASHDTYLL